MPSTPAIDLAVQRMLAEQLCGQLAKSALPQDGSAGAYSSLFAQVLADTVAGDATTTASTAPTTKPQATR